MASDEQVWHTAMPPPSRSSTTATVPRSLSSASSPGSPGSGSGPGSPCSGSDPRSPGSGSDPRSPRSGSDPGSPRSVSSPGSPGSGSDPRSPGSGSDPRSPGSVSDPRSPGSGSDPRSPRSGSDPGSPRSVSDPGSPRSVSSPGSPSSGSDPRSPRSVSSPGSPSSGSDPRSPGSGSDPRSPSSGSDPGSPRSVSSPGSPGTPGSEKVASPLECSICFSGYDNIFKTPKELSCTHVFCLECLARLAAAQPTGRPGSEAVPCPFCRQPTAVPAAGAPGLRTSRPLQARMPAHLRLEEPVWLEGTRLCCRPQPSAPGLPAPGFVCVDVGLRKPAEPAAPTPVPGPASRRGRLARCWARCRDWRRMALVTALLLVLFCVVLWPAHCALRTGNLRCLSRPPASTAPATATYAATVSLGPLADN